ncbi:hypothetical protein PROFUN_00136 [Planoprotostelium fungivorum]|uniref:Peptidase S54 rhomboid domain-containing protein n=1 Tax=Planoprotostelium fungivorum TaxID=1890364 RepID=A0A2P6P0R4_9EUKA|nr:hypothetical protein PROFUN_00136 [Planoprotostelium fungivorum]
MTSRPHTTTRPLKAQRFTDEPETVVSGGFPGDRFVNIEEHPNVPLEFVLTPPQLKDSLADRGARTTYVTALATSILHYLYSTGYDQHLRLYLWMNESPLDIMKLFTCPLFHDSYYHLAGSVLSWIVIAHAIQGRFKARILLFVSIVVGLCGTLCTPTQRNDSTPRNDTKGLGTVSWGLYAFATVWRERVTPKDSAGTFLRGISGPVGVATLMASYYVYSLLYTEMDDRQPNQYAHLGAILSGAIMGLSHRFMGPWGLASSGLILTCSAIAAILNAEWMRGYRCVRAAEAMSQGRFLEAAELFKGTVETYSGAEDQMSKVYAALCLFTSPYRQAEAWKISDSVDLQRIPIPGADIRYSEQLTNMKKQITNEEEMNLYMQVNYEDLRIQYWWAFCNGHASAALWYKIAFYNQVPPNLVHILPRVVVDLTITMQLAIVITARLAQSVERTALNRVVGGSSPPQKFCRESCVTTRHLHHQGSLAQWQCIRLQIGRLGVQVTQGSAFFHPDLKYGSNVVDLPGQVSLFSTDFL